MVNVILSDDGRISVGTSDLGRPRPARHRRRPHTLHAEARDGQGVAVLRHRGPARRPTVAGDLPHRRGRSAREAPLVRRACLHVPGVPAQAADGRVAQSVGCAVRGGHAGLPAHGDLLSRARRRGVRQRRDRRRRAGVQGARPGRRLRPDRSAARRGVGTRRGGTHPRRHPLRVGATARRAHRAGTDPNADGAASEPAPRRRPHGHARVRRLPRHL